MVTVKNSLHASGLVLLALLIQTPAGADDEIPRGLLAEYTQSGTTVTRIDSGISFVWDRAAPDQFLQPGQFSSDWTGQILIREETSYTFHAYVQGEVSVSVAGDPVLTAERVEAEWVSGQPVELGFGFKDLLVEYTRESGAGRLHLFWSSAQFPLEPLPEHLLFRMDDENGRVLSDVDFEQFDRGRQLFDACRCQRCHAPAADSLPPAPALTHVHAGTDTAWLLAKLQHKHAESADSGMPAFGFSEADARAIAAFILSRSEPMELLSPPVLKEDKENPLPDGDVLLYSVGCLACHRIGEFGNPGPFGGGDLTSIGARRSREWLYTKLTDQSRLGRHHQMPVIELSDEERVQLVDALLSRSEAESVRSDLDSSNELIGRGRQLFIDSRCYACHEVASFDAPQPGLQPLRGNVNDWSRTCLSEEPDRAGLRPAYPQADLAALRLYTSVMMAAETEVRLSEFERGERVLERRNCLQCHERGTQTGIVATAGKVAGGDSRLSGQSQALIPPNLTAVGDKLLDNALAEAVSGAPEARRMPWLSVRMPRFEHAAADKAALLAYLIGHDRIPAGAPASFRPDAVPADEQTLLAGQSLVGAGGFSCIACHEFGEYVPPNVAIATHGSDLLGLSGRLRPEYFLRWTRSPLRIVPGMEMPSYERPVPGILDADIDRQLSAIWSALNDPRFTTPTNPTAVEQLLVVDAGQFPRIVRDVFTVGDENGGGYVPRSLAVGFANGHSLLLDLDSGSIRGWTIGEFARQETQGKSWFWSLAGAAVATGLRDGGAIREIDESLQRDQASRELTRMDLHSYGFRGDAFWLRYAIGASSATDSRLFEVEEVWEPVGRGLVTGVRRSITIQHPGNALLLLALPRITPRLGDARIVTDAGDSAAVAVDPGDEWRGHVFQSSPGDPARRLTVQYLANLHAAPAQPIPAPEVEREYSPVTTVPGYEGARLRLPESIMPTAFAWRADGTLVFTSLKGHVYVAHDTDADGIEDSLTVFEEGLAAPFGVLPDGDDLLVAHKAELLRLRDNDGDGHCDERIVEADGWGYTHDYHDWVTGPVRDSAGNLYLATGSDYAHRDRAASEQHWRGKVLRINSAGEIDVFAHELRYPVGIALDAHDRLFVSDQQGVANTFNEINHVVLGGRYGVKSQADPIDEGQSLPPAVQIPHPWTRSVNGIFFLTADLSSGAFAPFAGHGVGCEYNNRFLMRFSLQEIDGQLQGAAYELTRPTWERESDTFLGPICGAVSPSGELFIGSIHDSGWLGGRNTGEIVRITPAADAVEPNGIREVRAVPEGFAIEFLRSVEASGAAEPASYVVSGYTRVWEGSYATPDSGRYAPAVRSAELSDDDRVVTLSIDDLRPGFVYEISCGSVASADGSKIWPNTAHYTMNVVPQ